MYRFDLPLLVSDVKVYPNPASDYIFFAWEGESPERIDIYDTHGRIVDSSQIKNQVNLRQSLVALTTGGYIANFIWKDGKELSKTFIKVSQ
jgi:hypothetical protein